MMNLKRSVLLPLATSAATLGVAGYMGCKASATTDEPPSTDPATQEADPSVVTDVGPTAASEPLPLPPAAKVEDQGPAPSEHDVWMNGYWWWDTSRATYSWSPGFWQDRTVEATFALPEVVYEDPGRAPGGDYTYMPGYWDWRGTGYVWFHGYWGAHRDGFAYLHPFWESVGGHWSCGGWGGSPTTLAGKDGTPDGNSTAASGSVRRTSTCA